MGIIRAIISLARGLDIKTIAKGVENSKLKFKRSFGKHYQLHPEAYEIV